MVRGKMLKPLAPENMTKLARAIRKHLNVHKMTYEEFATAVAHVRWQCRKCRNQHVIKWLNGSMPDAFHFTAIMQVIGCTNPNELFEDQPGSMDLENEYKHRRKF